MQQKSFGGNELNQSDTGPCKVHLEAIEWLEQDNFAELSLLLGYSEG